MQLRNTKQRQTVLQAVQARKDHPTADQLYLDIVEIDPKISRGTVYRNLNLLAKTGEIRHIKVPGADRFDFRLDDHYHLMCLECGNVCDVPLCYNHELDADITKRTGYQIKLHRLVFEGICPECLKNNHKSF